MHPVSPSGCNCPERAASAGSSVLSRLPIHTVAHDTHPLGLTDDTLESQTLSHTSRTAGERTHLAMAWMHVSLEMTMLTLKSHRDGTAMGVAGGAYGKSLPSRIGPMPT